ncbi:MAG TPA: 3-phosphoserine/phosphohydroxythreonine transaminase [Verrucomicrobiae bacterium]|nr:3-phosphoserine/phosphohydroxythreonine transaminase [Verrucomicrobiae bacterium]
MNRGTAGPRVITLSRANHYNFSGGPGALPESVLEETQRALLQAPGHTLGLLGISHRSPWFRSIVDEAEANIRHLLHLPRNYRVLFLQGGGSLQFSMVPMTLLRGSRRPAEYIETGYWSQKAIVEARREGPVRVLWNGSAEGYRRLPRPAELLHRPDAAYLHYVSNETVEGLQFHRLLGNQDVLRVCDMSSDFLSRPLDPTPFALIYAHAQKNLGPAGVTVVIVRDDVLQRAPRDLPAMLDYREHARMGSIYNTAPVFAIYVTMLVTRWLRHEVGGLELMDVINRGKAAELYDAIDSSDGFYRGHAAPGDRSLMNVVFSLPAPELEALFLAQAESAGFHGLAGHRSLGGIRASLYNAVSPDAVDALRGFMEFFRRRHENQREV